MCIKQRAGRPLPLRQQNASSEELLVRRTPLPLVLGLHDAPAHQLARLDFAVRWLVARAAALHPRPRVEVHRRLAGREQTREDQARLLRVGRGRRVLLQEEALAGEAEGGGEGARARVGEDVEDVRAFVVEHASALQPGAVDGRVGRV